MDVSKNRGTAKWMVYNGKPYEQMDDLGGKPIFLETPISWSPGTMMSTAEPGGMSTGGVPVNPDDLLGGSSQDLVPFQMAELHGANKWG